MLSGDPTTERCSQCNTHKGSAVQARALSSTLRSCCSAASVLPSSPDLRSSVRDCATQAAVSDIGSHSAIAVSCTRYSGTRIPRVRGFACGSHSSCCTCCCFVIIVFLACSTRFSRRSSYDAADRVRRSGCGSQRKDRLQRIRTHHEICGRSQTAATMKTRNMGAMA